MNNTRVVGVTVTYNRAETLRKTIEALTNQKYKVEKIIVVDNNSNEENKEKLRKIEKDNDLVEVIWRDDNLGGAGGFHYGMKLALEKYNPDWYWIMDDDAYPRVDCLEKLFEGGKKLSNIGFLAPAIYGIDNNEYQMYHHKFISKNKVNDITAVEKYEYLNKVTEVEANAFVGPLFSREAVNLVGIPDKGLFIYGDDTEYTYRVSRKFKGYVVKDAVINHQDPPYQGKVVAPQAWWKEYYMFRNRFLFVDKFAETKLENCIGKIYLVGHLTRRILATMLKADYKGFRKPRVELLKKAIFDGMRKVNGKTIDPKEYIDSLKNI
ncbi:glycosyltransferase [Clostridium gasigenes]|uniref:glycosyltransferase n=1 Tax=Clostridium gasigenes TaxID=94869 RepID=UPI001C0B7CBC|nr:glycosyltransferase [Clostridium gasigenes]MBU3103156.1 glycosyltransferase [Clostridium gasigenes]